MVLTKNCTGKQPFEKKLKFTRLAIAFNDNDLEGTIQPHDNALVVIAQINGCIVKRVLIDQGSGAEVMYPDLFKGIGLKNEDLSKYDTPLVGFDGRMVILEGYISLLVNMEGKEVTLTFIVVTSYSPYTMILGRPWIHAIEAVPSTLHVNVKFCTEQGIIIVRGNQQWPGSAWWPQLTKKSSKKNQPRKFHYSNYKSPNGKWGLVVLKT